MLSFFPRDVLDEILNLTESVSEGFPSYSFPRMGRKEVFLCMGELYPGHKPDSYTSISFITQQYSEFVVLLSERLFQTQFFSTHIFASDNSDSPQCHQAHMPITVF